MNAFTLFHKRAGLSTSDYGAGEVSVITDGGSGASNTQSPSGNRPWARALLAAFLCLLILPVASARHADSIAVFHCAFGEDWDVNYDRWPDRWVRKAGPEYPHYVNIAIGEDAAAAGGNCLSIRLDGAAAAVVSPPISVISRFSYYLEAVLKNEQLNHSKVVARLEFCDASGRVLQVETTEEIGNTNGWQKVFIGPVEPHDPSIDRVVVSLQVVRGDKGDLQGRVSLADVWLERLPRIDITTNNLSNVYTRLEGVEVKCAVSGIRERDPEIHFELFDESNHLLQRESFRLDGQLIVDKKKRPVGIAAGSSGPDGYEGTRTWKPRIPDYGFYRVAVRMVSSESDASLEGSIRPLGSRTVDLVVAPPLEMPRKGEFGWTLPDGDQPLAFQELSRLLPEVGVNLVKVPVWFSANNPRRGDELIRFVEMLGASYIDVVGIIDRPPAAAAGPNMPRDISIADVLSVESSPWSAALEPVMSRLALRVRWWQLGSDFDTSLIGLPTLNKRMEKLRTALFRFGQDVRLGLCSEWEASSIYSGKVAWDFVQLTTPVQPSSQSLDQLIVAQPSNTAQRWIMIEPADATSISATISEPDEALCMPICAVSGGLVVPLATWVETAVEMPRQSEAFRKARATDFVHRLIKAKLHGADAIFVARPFDNERGLMREDGMPSELLLPWRTTAAMLGGAKYLGEIQLPAGSENRIFLRPDGQVVMVLWSVAPAREVLYLGANVRHIDLTGRTRQVTQQGRDQVIEVGPIPTFVLGLHEAIARWRMYARFEHTQIPSIFSKPHANAMVFKNFFPQGIGGSAKLVVVQNQLTNESGIRSEAISILDRWTIEPPKAAFQLAPDAETKFPFDIKLKNALFGKQPIRIDFTIEAEERLQFSVYSEIEVGTADLTLEVRSYLDKDGMLVVEQHMTNLTDRLADFKCHLRSFGRQPKRMHIYRLGRQPDRKVYRIPDGRELVGKEMLLEIEELNGPRMLHYRFIPSDLPPPVEEPRADALQQPGCERTGNEGDGLRPLARVGS